MDVDPGRRRTDGRLNGAKNQKKGANLIEVRAPFLLAVPNSYSVQRRMINVALMPPNPNEFERPMSKLCGMDLLGT
jgi:hypothetical protein